MDRREAIEWLKDIKESGVLTDWSYDVALDLAIEALRQTESEDCISRTDTVNALCRKCGLEHKCGGADCNENWCPDVKVVMNMPPVEPERPKRTETMMVDG